MEPALKGAEDCWKPSRDSQSRFWLLIQSGIYVYCIYLGGSSWTSHFWVLFFCCWKSRSSTSSFWEKCPSGILGRLSKFDSLHSSCYISSTFGSPSNFKKLNPVREPDANEQISTHFQLTCKSNNTFFYTQFVDMHIVYIDDKNIKIHRSADDNHNSEPS